MCVKRRIKLWFSPRQIASRTWTQAGRPGGGAWEKLAAWAETLTGNARTNQASDISCEAKSERLHMSKVAGDSHDTSSFSVRRGTHGTWCCMHSAGTLLVNASQVILVALFDFKLLCLSLSVATLTLNKSCFFPLNIVGMEAQRRCVVALCLCKMQPGRRSDPGPSTWARIPIWYGTSSTTPVSGLCWLQTEDSDHFRAGASRHEC